MQLSSLQGLWYLQAEPEELRSLFAPYWVVCKPLILEAAKEGKRIGCVEEHKLQMFVHLLKLALEV